MTVNIYLCYYDTKVVNGRNQYYFRAVFLPTSLKGELLLFLLERIGQIDLSDYFDIKVIPAPNFILEGSQIYAFNNGAGGIFTAPTDLYSVWTLDYPAFDATFLTYKPNRAPWVCYIEIPPADISHDDIVEPMNALIPPSGYVYTPTVPDDFVLREIQVCSTGRINYGPATIIPALLWTYQGLVEEDFPDTQNYEHVTNPAAFDGSTGETWEWIILFTGYLSGIFPGSPYESFSAQVALKTDRENAGVQCYFLHCPQNTWTWVGGYGYNWTTTAYPFSSRVRFYEPKEDKPVVAFNPEIPFLNITDVPFLPFLLSPIKEQTPIVAPFQVFMVDSTAFEVAGTPLEVRE